MAVNKDFKDLVEKCMYLLKIKQKDLAPLLDISPSYLTDIKNGKKTASNELIEKLSKIASEAETNKSETEVTSYIPKANKEKVFDLKAFRKDKNITQKEIAEIFSCNQNFISRIESGIRPLPADKMEILQSAYGDISDYFKEDLERQQNDKQTKQVQANDDSLEFIAANEADFSSMIVRMMNEKQIAPYGLLADKDREIAELNRQIGKLEALLEVAKKEAAQVVGNATVADAG